MGISSFVHKVRRRETPFYDRLYRMGKAARNWEMPYLKGLHDTLYHERVLRIEAWRSFWRVMYYQPLFRGRCERCGKRLYISHSGQGLPFIQGDLKMTIGEDVTLFDRMTLAAVNVGESPRLIIGDHTDIGQPVSILVGNEVRIGSHCIIGSSLIADNPGHNLDFRKRGKGIHRVLIGKVTIGDHVWAAYGSIIIGNVTIGDCAVIGARAVVTKSVPPFCVVAGNPARIVYKLPIPPDMVEKLGEAQYRSYCEANVER